MADRFTWLNVGNLPADRNDGGMCWTGLDDVYFGGLGPGAFPTDFKNDAYVWDGGTRTWSTTSQVTRPSGRFGPGMATIVSAFAPGAVLFGGMKVVAGVQTRSDETWHWDASTQTWTNLTPAGPPAPRSYANMAYDPLRDVVVLWGGQNAGVADLQTWEYDGTNWTQQFPANGPDYTSPGIIAGPPNTVAMWFDPRTNQVVVSSYDGEFWGWDGGPDWNDLGPSPVIFPTDLPVGGGYTTTFDLSLLILQSGTYVWDGATFTPANTVGVDTWSGGVSMPVAEDSEGYLINQGGATTSDITWMFLPVAERVRVMRYR